MRKGFDFTGVTVVFFCHDGKGKFLMNLRSKNCRDEHGTWDIGGGGLEVHDTVENTLISEIKQEYCTDVLDSEFLGFRDLHRIHNNEKTHWIALDFKVLVDISKVAIGEPHKFDDLKWFTFDAVPNPIHSGVQGFFKKYKDKLF